MSTIFAFVKLFEKIEHAESFLQGKLYMNTIRSFKEYKDKNGELRGDNYEGIIAMYQPEKLKTVKLGDLEIPASEIASPIVIHGDDLLNHNVFCIYSLNSRGYDSISADNLLDFKRTLELHDSCFGLGNFCVVVTNASLFIERCRLAIVSKNYDGKLGLVDYFDEHEHHGAMDEENHGFQKRSLFSHQREYRVKIKTDNDVPSPYTLDIGSLSDIASIMTPEDFNNLLLLKLPDGSSA